MSAFTHGIHLAKRFVGMLSRRPVTAADSRWAETVLLDRERALWARLSVPDQRHSVQVARRFVDLRPDATRDDIAAALLHDIGKLLSELGPFARVVATVVGARTKRFRRYHDHEALGAAMLAEAGSSERTQALVGGTCVDADATAALRSADDI